MRSVYDGVALTIFLIGFFVLFQKKIRTSETWRATVTPLASIIGSGFLVSAPLLIFSSGSWAVFVMIGIVIIAYAVGYSIRFNIQYVEPALQNASVSSWIFWVDEISRPILGCAYIISVTFYLKLLSAFAFKGLTITEDFCENCLTTAILLIIGISGRLKGLSMLELLETYSVNTKLAIIFALIVTFSLFNAELFMNDAWHLEVHPRVPLWHAIRMTLGMLIIVQGFETSRYIGEAHSRKMRINTMKYAQWISGIIYICFVALSTVIFHNGLHISETTVIDLTKVVASYLPYLLIVAAVMSQFSAAVSDTLGGGGLLAEALHYKLKSNQCYFILAILGIGLTWLTDIFQIISIASKAFALYYALQIVLSLLTLQKNKGRIKFFVAKYILFSCLLTLMLMVLILGIPVE